MVWSGVRAPPGLCALATAVRYRIFFAEEVVTEGLHHFSAGAAILAELIHLDEGTPQEGGVGPQDTSAEVTRVPRNVPHANDTGIVRRSSLGLTEVLAISCRSVPGVWADGVTEKIGDDTHARAAYGCTDMENHGSGLVCLPWEWRYRAC